VPRLTFRSSTLDTCNETTASYSDTTAYSPAIYPSNLNAMRLFKGLLGVSILAVSVTNSLAASWTFADASVSVQSKGTGVGGGRKDR